MPEVQRVEVEVTFRLKVDTAAAPGVTLGVVMDQLSPALKLPAGRPGIHDAGATRILEVQVVDCHLRRLG